MQFETLKDGLSGPTVNIIVHFSSQEADFLRENGKIVNDDGTNVVYRYEQIKAVFARPALVAGHYNKAQVYAIIQCNALQPYVNFAHFVQTT